MTEKKETKKEAQEEAQKEEKNQSEEENKSVKGVTVDFDKARETFTLELPSFKGSEVEVYKTLKFGESGQVQKYRGSEEFEGGLKAIELLIKDWNLYDQEGNKLPIEEDIIKELPASDVAFLINELEGFLKNEEKIKEEFYKK